MKQHINSVSYKLHAHLMPINIPSLKITFIQIIKIVCKREEDILCDIKFRSKIFFLAFFHSLKTKCTPIYIQNIYNPMFTYCCCTNMQIEKNYSSSIRFGKFRYVVQFFSQCVSKGIALKQTIKECILYVCNIVCIMGHEESICLCFLSTWAESKMRYALMSTTYLH